MDIKEEPTGKNRGLEELTNRFYGNSLHDVKFAVNKSVRFLTMNGSASHVSDFKFLEPGLRYLERGSKYYVDVVARSFRRPGDFGLGARFLNVWLDLVAIRLVGAEEYQRIAAISKRKLPSLSLLKSPPPPVEFLRQLEFGNLVEFAARITAGTPMIFDVSSQGFNVLKNGNLGGSR